jgi:hypothetical protein
VRKNQNEDERLTISGEPYYQAYKNFDYWLSFNNQNQREESNSKLLLNMPLIPPKFHSVIRYAK